jgi:class 3 adenylate cyclase
LFADVTGSTTLGEQLDPEQLRDVLATYFAAMREEIEAEGGTVEKFIGDAVMAAFGVPVAHEDDSARALRAALRMLERLDSVNSELASAHGVSLRIRIGVNTGEVLASTDPSPGEPMVTGDAVNTAARLQSSAEPGGVMVAERTVRAVRGFRFGDPAHLDLKGKEGAFPARPLIGLEEEPERGIPGLSAPMVGRNEELGLLRSLYGRVGSERRPHLVTVYGEPGVGKSRLTREFLAWASESDPPPLVLSGRCLPYGDGVTYWPLAEILMSHAGIGVGDPADTVVAKVRAACSSQLEDLGELEPGRACAALAYTLGVDDPDNPMSGREPRQIRHEMHLSWRGLLTRLASGAPTVVVVEDIHWADPALLDLLEEIADRAEGALLVICPARPSLLDRRQGWGGGRRNASGIVLDPLSPDEADRLISLLLAIDDLPASTHESIKARAEGNPFFLEEIVRQLIDEELIAYEDGRWHAVARIADVEIPDTVQAVLAARIDLLEPVGKRTLQLASVVGRVFWPGPVERLLNGERAALAETLDHLESRDLVRSRVGSSIAGEAEYSFKHILTRDVAYESLPRRDRARAHAAVAAWIESVASANEYSELLAYHYDEAYRAEAADPRGDPEAAERLRQRAMEWIKTAGSDAASRFSMAKALSMAERLVGLSMTPLELAEALELRGGCALADYRGELAWQSYKEAVDLRLAEIPEDRLAIAEACAGAVEAPMRWPGSLRTQPSEEEVRRYLEIGLSAAGPEESVPLVRLLGARSFVPFAYGSRRDVPDEESEEAVASGVEAADIAERLGRPDLASMALDGAGAALVERGMYAAASELGDRRLAAIDAIDDAFEVGDVFAMSSWNRLFTGDVEAAASFARRGADLCRGLGAEGVEIHNLAWLAFAHYQAGRWDEVLGELLPRVELLLGDRVSAPPYFTQNLFGSAAAIATLRSVEPLGGRLRAVLRWMAGERAESSPGSGGIGVWFARSLLAEGQTDEAERMIGWASRSSSRAAWPHSIAVEALMLGDVERWDAVPGLLERGRSYAESAGVGLLPPHLDRLEGRVAFADGDVAGGALLLTRARDGFEELKMPWERAYTELILAESLAASESEGAMTHLDRAVPVLEELRSVRELDRARDLREKLDAGNRSEG